MSDLENSALTPSTHIAVVGGGLVGALTALLIARARPDLTLTVIEPQLGGPARDPRSIALAAGTVELLQELGIWSELAAEACAIEHIHVSDRGFAGMTRLHAAQEGVAALGQVIAAARLNQALYQACQAHAQISWQGGVAVTALQLQPAQVVLQLAAAEDLAKPAEALAAQLVLAADGNHSTVRDLLGIALHTTDYAQQGIIARLELAQSLQGWAFERFTETGPLALLPLPADSTQPGRHFASLVWSLAPADAEAMLAAPEEVFLTQLQQAFGYRAGTFVGIENRIAYPLQLRLAEQSTHHRVILLGNASHALHPIAGQGFNLGVRDAMSIAECLRTDSATEANGSAEDAGRYALIRQYWQTREADYAHTIGLTQWLVHGFSNRHPLLVAPRNLALLALEKIDGARHAFAKRAMGKSV